jgi:hypothetical protein
MRDDRRTRRTSTGRVIAVPQSGEIADETAFRPGRKHPATNRRYRTRNRQGSVVSTRQKMFRRIIKAIPQGVRRLLQYRYRPERHYMRGRGPACAARNPINH